MLPEGEGKRAQVLLPLGEGGRRPDEGKDQRWFISSVDRGTGGGGFQVAHRSTRPRRSLDYARDDSRSCYTAATTTSVKSSSGSPANAATAFTSVFCSSPAERWRLAMTSSSRRWSPNSSPSTFR